MLRAMEQIAESLGQAIRLFRQNRPTIGKRDMIHNDATPHLEVNPETYEVRADGELPMTQRYFLF